MKRFQKILATGFSRENLDENIWAKIEKLTEKLIFEPEDGVDCLFSRFNKVDKQLIDSLSALKYIGLLATGTGTVDLNYAKEKGITVCNVPGYATESVAEWVFGLILEHLRQLEKAKQTARSGDFSGDGFSATEIKGKKFGIIGLGRIGQRVAQIAQGFGADVVYWSRTKKASFKYESLDTLIKTCDFISLHGLTLKDTYEILDITKVKPGAVVINVSGMEQVNIPALEKRLAKNDITFILDHPDEMKPENVKKLTKFPNCIIYPPIGFVSTEARVNKQQIFVSNLENFLAGKSINMVN